jgi:hypothetical protein
MDFGTQAGVVVTKLANILRLVSSEACSEEVK